MRVNHSHCRWLLRQLALVLLSCAASLLYAATDVEQDAPVFDDRPLDEPLGQPDWFKLSFLDIADDAREARAAGKQGLLVYVGQKYCPYCKMLLEKNFGLRDIQEYTEKHFDVIGIDIHGSRSVTDVDGAEGSERSYALRHKLNFTPTLLFYDGAGKEVFRLSGYYPPYQFRAALEYVADAHYRRESFRQYLERATGSMVFDSEDLNPENFFLAAPYALSRTHHPGERPLIVFYEQPDCHACDVLHTGPLMQPEILARIGQFESVQLNLWGDKPVITPDGLRTTERAWAEKLGLFYAPTLLIFDHNGAEILRVDSVVQFYRLRNVLDYIASGAYLKYPTFQDWREGQEKLNK